MGRSRRRGDGGDLRLPERRSAGGLVQQSRELWLGECRTFQVAVADVEAIAGIDLGLLVTADVRGASVRGEPWIELASIADIRLS